MKLGVRVHDFGKSTAGKLALETQKMGFSCVQLVLNKAIKGESGEAGTLTKEKAVRIARIFNDRGVSIAMLGAYFNPVHSNPDKIRASILKFKEHLKYARYFNSLYVGTETGSYNDDEWTFNPINLTDEAYIRVRNVIADLLAAAKESNSFVVIEGSCGHVINNPEKLKKLHDEVDNGYMKITVDICNYLNIDNYRNQKEIFDKCIELFREQIVIFHLKDFIIENEALKNVGLGQGLMDFGYMIPKIKKLCPNAYCIFEEVKPEDMETSLKFIKG